MKSFYKKIKMSHADSEAKNTNVMTILVFNSVTHFIAMFHFYTH